MNQGAAAITLAFSMFGDDVNNRTPDRIELKSIGSTLSRKQQVKRKKKNKQAKKARKR